MSEQSKTLTKEEQEQAALTAYAQDIEAVNKKHNMQIVPRLEVQYIEKPKQLIEVPDPIKIEVPS